MVASFCESASVGRVAIGDPRGIGEVDAGRVHNRRVARWAHARAARALVYRLEELGISSRRVGERGTSSICPSCLRPATKSGRVLVCSDPTCRRRHHRDVAGAQNMVRKLVPDHVSVDIARLEHRQVGSPARRDRRRQLHDRSRSRPGVSVLPVPGPPPQGGVARLSGEDSR
jgi:transposase